MPATAPADLCDSRDDDDARKGRRGGRARRATRHGLYMQPRPGDALAMRERLVAVQVELEMLAHGLDTRTDGFHKNRIR
jgi:hypothetical protein